MNTWQSILVGIIIKTVRAILSSQLWVTIYELVKEAEEKYTDIPGKEKKAFVMGEIEKVYSLFEEELSKFPSFVYSMFIDVIVVAFKLDIKQNA